MGFGGNQFDASAVTHMREPGKPTKNLLHEQQNINTYLEGTELGKQIFQET